MIIMSEGASSEFLSPYFTNLKVIGTGGSGAVYSAIDVESDQSVALKRVILRDRMNCRATLREVKILKQLNHENIVELVKVVDSEGKTLHEGAEENFKDSSELYFCEELLDLDLHQVLQNKGKLREDYVKFFLYQLLRGLKYVHSANVVHRDIKPSNLLVNSETLLLKIGDFGRSRVVDPAYSHRRYLTHRISTLWYKAPELLLNSSVYDGSVDVWAAGCVFAEMLLGKPLFEGAHEMEQMELILHSVCLTEKEWANLQPQLSIQTAERRTRMQGAPLGSKFSHIDIQALDLLVKMLKFNPSKRITVEEALSHPYLQQYSFPSDEPICVEPLHIEDEVDDFEENLLKSCIFDECVSWHTEHEKLLDTSKPEPALEEIVVQKPDCENSVLSLKEIMQDSDEPVLDEVLSRPFNSGYFLGECCDDVTENLSFENRTEELAVLAAALKIEMSLNKNAVEKDLKRGPLAQVPNIPSVLDSVFGKGYLKETVDFSCKRNVFNGPFGLCYF